MTTTSFDKDDRRSSLIRELLTYISQSVFIFSDASSAEGGGSKTENVKDFMKARGLEAWHGHLTKHLDIKTPSQLKAITAIDLRR